ncbi:LssY-like C-terminal domain protein (plasmid) [Gemmatirosa kalamazoonensis]|uniref:LssY-like C-terminal domain protein n=1 Tax=Gemmatirosa kalamazoonensis TaxID=861299 RepID=W0RRQ5_9BACT|nr:LssY-like C-terminal domain protein [Gemmatirosa kalamazoonensis]
MALLGSASEVARAFTAAGWTTPARSKLRGELATILAAARGRGFGAQPFTTLQLDGRPPTLAFEKVVNSMAKRHHARAWPWGDVDGQPLWLVAATRDDGMRYSRARHAVTHRIDPDVDAERDKIVDDLVAASAVAARSYVARTPPDGPVLVNDGTTPAVTDWRLAVLVLR